MATHNVNSALISQPIHIIHLLTHQTYSVQLVIMNAVLIFINKDESYVEVNGQCLSSFINIINTVGGVNMLISAGIIVCAIIGYLIIVLFEKLT